MCRQNPRLDLGYWLEFFGLSLCPISSGCIFIQNCRKTRGKKKFSINIAVMIGSYFIGQLSFTYTRGPLFGNLFKNRPAKSNMPDHSCCFQKWTNPRRMFFKIPLFRLFLLLMHQQGASSQACTRTKQIQYKWRNTKQIQYKTNTVQIKHKQNKYKSVNKYKASDLFSQVSQPTPFTSQDAQAPFRDQTKILLNPSFLHQISVFLSLPNALPNISVFFNQRWELLMTIIVN